MIGDIHLYSNEVMVEVNDGGTLEVQPRIGWFWQLVLVIKHHFNRQSLSEIRRFCHRHGREY